MTSAAVRRLQAHGLTIERVRRCRLLWPLHPSFATSLATVGRGWQLLAIPEDELALLIRPVGFWRRKAVYLRQASQRLLDCHAGDVPPTRAALEALPGVGPKMATTALNVCYGASAGACGIDRRHCNQLRVYQN